MGMYVKLRIKQKDLDGQSFSQLDEVRIWCVKILCVA